MGCFLSTTPVFAMEGEDTEYAARLHQQTIENPDIVPYLLEFVDTPSLPNTLTVCKTWSDCAIAAYPRRLQMHKEKVLSFLRERPYCETLKPIISSISVTDRNAAISLFHLHNICKENEELFPPEIEIATSARNRMDYSIALTCGPQIWDHHNPMKTVNSDELVLEHESNTPAIGFLKKLLQKSSVDFIFLNGNFFRPISTLSTLNARGLGEAVKCSSLGSITLNNVTFQTKALPIFLNQAAQNTKLQKVDLSTIRCQLDKTEIDTLIQETPEGLSFELILPEKLIWSLSFPASLAAVLSNSDYCGAVNAELREKLITHFGDKVKFVAKRY